MKLYCEPQPIFDRFGITRQLENAFSRQVHLKSGGYIVVDETEALVAIDVNTGRHKGTKDQESTILKVNVEAADEISRQLRLRNMGGLIVLDFIDMKHQRDQRAEVRGLWVVREAPGHRLAAGRQLAQSSAAHGAAVDVVHVGDRVAQGRRAAQAR